MASRIGQTTDGCFAEGPLVSVVVPVFNVEDYIDQCLGSIAAQTYGNLQVVVVDDGSTDGSGRLCDDWAARDPRIEVVHQDNRGLSAARNAGIDRAAGDFIVFVDSDDYVLERFVETLLAAAVGLGVDCAACGFVWLYEDRREVSLPSSELEVVSSRECLRRILEGPRGGYQIDTAPWNRMYARSLFEEHGIRFPEGRLFEGTATVFPLAYRSNAIALIPDAPYMHRSRAGSTMRTRSMANMLDSLEAGESFFSEVAAHYPDLAQTARAKRERLLIASWMAWLDGGGESNPDVAESMVGALREAAVANRRALRLPADLRYLAVLSGLLAFPDAVVALRRLRRYLRDIDAVRTGRRPA